MTNADRIRAMSDEELANLIDSDWCERVCGGNDFGCDVNCEKHILDWLREELPT